MARAPAFTRKGRQDLETDGKMCLSDLRAKDLENVFKLIDTDKDGYVTEADLAIFMRERVGCDVDEEGMRVLFTELFSSPTTVAAKPCIKEKKITFSAFVAFMEKQRRKPLPQLLSDIFNHIDTNRDGFISPTELLAFSHRMGLQLNVDGASHLLASCSPFEAGAAPPTEATAGVTLTQFCELVQRATSVARVSGTGVKLL